MELIKRALYGVTQEGTSVRSFVGAPYKSGGKTGTAQAVGIKANEKYNAAKMDEHQRDHSLYIAFAPLEAPTIALAVVVENAGFGSEAAAPIARRVFDYLLPASARARRTWPPRSRASRARRSARRGARSTCRCRARRPAPPQSRPLCRASQALAAVTR